MSAASPLSPSAHIRALVSGLPAPRRQQRLLYMLQAYVDDSKSIETPQVFILGGYIAPSEKWEQFSDEWQRVLDMRPPIHYYKFNEAERLEGEFYAWSEKRRDERVILLRRVIEEFASAEISIRFKIDAHRKAFASWGRHHRNPYYFATAHLMGVVGRNLEKLGIEPQPLEFIFDNQVIEKGKVIEGWDWAVKRARPNPADLLSKILVNPPTFRDDKDVLPLQAADMCAGWWRTFSMDKLNGREPKIYRGFQKQLRGVFVQFNEEQMRELAEKGLRDLQTRPELRSV